MKFLSLAAASTLSILSPKALAGVQSVSIDIGNVTLAIRANPTAEPITHTFPASCRGSSILVKRPSTGVIEITHTGARCESGASITIPVSVASAIEFKLQAGALKIADPEKALAKLSLIDLSVGAGTIVSSVLTTKRSEDFAGATAKSRRADGNGHSFRAEVVSGVIHY